MSIVDGQRVRALESNAAWASKTNDNTMLGVQTLSNAGSGASIANVQQTINDLSTDLATAENDITQLQTDVTALQNQQVYEHAGSWDASTNTPALADGDGALPFGVGAVYRVSVAGTQNLGSGSITFAVGDRVVYNASGVYEKWDVNDADINLNDLLDVDTTGVANRDVLRYDGTNWVDFNLNQSANDSTSGSNATLASVGENSVIRLTNGSLVSIDMIPAGYSGQKFILINATGVTLSVNDETGGTAANRILTGTGSALSMSANANLWLCYDGTSSRWRVVGGSGGSGSVGYQESLAGTVNGVNTTFGPMTYVASNEDSILVLVDGVGLDKSEWSLSGSNIVLSVAPVAGQTVYVFYVTGGASALPTFSNVFKVEYRTITGGEATAKSLTLAQSPAVPGEVMLDLIGGGAQNYSDDFTVSGTTLTWNGLGLDGILTAGDKVRINYVY